MAHPTLNPVAATATFLLKPPRPDLALLRAMVDAVGARSLSALVRCYLDEGLSRDTRRLVRKGRRRWWIPSSLPCSWASRALSL